MTARVGRSAYLAFCLLAACGDNLKPESGETGILVITPGTPLETTEGGNTASFQVALTHRPGTAITVTLDSMNASEGEVIPATLTIQPQDWDKPQSVQVRGVDDDVDDGDTTYAVRVSASDERGSGDITVTNRDDDTAGVTVTPTSGLQTSEAGTAATFTVVLLSKPVANVVIPVVSSRTAEGSVSTSMLTFTTLNWNAAQTVTVTGVDDVMQDDNQNYSINLGAATTSDGKYSGFDPVDVSLVNLDNDVANFLVTPTTGLETNESAGFATFTVRLLTQPSANVTIDVESDNSGEGTASVATLTFTTLNWNAPQEVKVTGVNDNIADGAVTYHVVLDNVVSADTNYTPRDPTDVTLSNLDNDTAGATVTLVATSPNFTTEAGGEAQFDVVLLSQPTANVTFPVTSGIPAEGQTPTTSLVFTSANWNAPQRVTVKGQDDFVADGDQTYAIVIGADASYTDINGDPVNPDDVSLTNKDNDQAGIVISRSDVLQTNEDGTADSFTVVLLSQPTADVSITYSSSNTAEGTVNPPSPIVFTTTDWNQEKTITVIGVDDSPIPFVRDGNQQYQIDLGVTSTDTTYAALASSLAPVRALNIDNDTATIKVEPTTLDVSEFGDFEEFEIVLTTAPLFPVTIPLRIVDTSEGQLDKDSVTFTALNWDVRQKVRVTGKDDTAIDGQQVFTVFTDQATSTDAFYAGQDAADVTVTNFDDESPGVYVQGHNLLKTLEGSNQPQFIRMRLTIAPTGGATVTCTVRSSDTSEVTIDPMVFTFDASNFDVMQTITVRGVDDADLDGDQLVTIITEPCTSTDPVYNLFNPRDIKVLNRDNE
jgi:large repetitive protein